MGYILNEVFAGIVVETLYYEHRLVLFLSMIITNIKNKMACAMYETIEKLRMLFTTCK